MIVGLDLSLRGSGVAVITEDGKAHTATFGYNLVKPTSHDQILRNISIARSVIKFLKQHGAKYVAIENYGFAGHMLTKQAELAGLIKAQVFLNFKTVVIPIPSKTIRAFLIPNTKKPGKKKDTESGERNLIVSTKKPVEDHLRSLGYNSPENDNEFDALAVALVMKSYVEREHGKWNKQQADLLKRIDEQMVKD